MGRAGEDHSPRSTDTERVTAGRSWIRRDRASIDVIVWWVRNPEATDTHQGMGTWGAVQSISPPPSCSSWVAG